MSLEPFYSDEFTTIYCGDSAEVIAELDPSTVGVVLTDPPYGISLDTDYSKINDHLSPRNKQGKQHKLIVGNDELFDPSVFLQWPCVLFGANCYAARLPETGTWHVWDKRCDGDSTVLADFEIYWTSFCSGPSRIYRQRWYGFGRKNDDRGYLHPSQKPVALMRQIMQEPRFPTGTVLDPFAGSGTTLKVAADLRIKSIGIEIDAEYCQIAVDRLAQKSFDLWNSDETE